MDGGPVGIGIAIALAAGLLWTFSVLAVLISCVAMLFWLASLASRVFRRAGEYKAEWIARSLRAPARIIVYRPTSTYVLGDCVYEVLLEVAPPGEAPFEAKVFRIPTLEQLARLQPGSVVEVRYDPTNRKRVEILGL